MGWTSPTANHAKKEQNGEVAGLQEKVEVWNNMWNMQVSRSQCKNLQNSEKVGSSWKETKNLILTQCIQSQTTLKCVEFLKKLIKIIKMSELSTKRKREKKMHKMSPHLSQFNVALTHRNYLGQIIFKS